MGLKSSISIIVSLLLISSSTQQSVNQPQPVTYHHLKWITNQTKFPLEMSVAIPMEQSVPMSAASHWDWLRHNDGKFVSKMEDLMKNYLIMETKDKASLIVVNYDNRTHEQLGSYEPKMARWSQLGQNPGGERVVELNNAVSNKRDVFTLAYLKDHYIKTEKFPDRIKVTCNADFLVANTTMIDTIMSLMERYGSFKMAVKSMHSRHTGRGPAPRVSSHNRYHLRPMDVRPPNNQQQQRRPQQNHQQQQIQQMVQQQQINQQIQQIQQQLQHQQQLENMNRQIQSQPVVGLPHVVQNMVTYQPPPPQLLQRDQVPISQAKLQPVAPIEPQQLAKGNQTNDQASQQQKQQQQPDKESIQQSIQQVQQQLNQDQKATQYQQYYHPVHHAAFIPTYQYARPLQPAAYPNDLLNFYNSLFNPSQEISYPQQSPNPQLVSTAIPLSQQIQTGVYNSPSAYIIPQSSYEYYFGPRLGKRDVRSSMVDHEQAAQNKFDYDMDYDASKFVKIRLSLGPISIYRPFEREEVVSCDLNLINVDSFTLDYTNKIFAAIDTSSYMNQDDDDDNVDEADDNEPKNEAAWMVNGKPMKHEKNDMMFLIDAKNVDPAIEIKKEFAKKPVELQEEILSHMRDKPIKELIEMERQLIKSSSAAFRVGYGPAHWIMAIVCVFAWRFF